MEEEWKKKGSYMIGMYERENGNGEDKCMCKATSFQPGDSFLINLAVQSYCSGFSTLTISSFA